MNEIKYNCRKNYIRQTKVNLATRITCHHLSSSNQEINVINHILDNLNYYIDFNNRTVLVTANI